MNKELNAAEAVYGFVGWLTSREERTVMSAKDDCAPIAELIKRFCTENNLPEVSDQWPLNLIHPSGEVAVPNAEASRLGSPELQAMIIARCVEKDQADSVPAVSDLPPLPAPDLRDVGTKPQEIKEFLKGYATEYARTAIAARAPADSVQEDAALWHWLAEYLVGTRTDLDDELVACETVNDLRKLVKAAMNKGATK